jgi:hypothetical protein
MRTFAYCSTEYVDATRRAAGVEPFCCPPFTAETLELSLLEGNDLIFINLHSLPGTAALLGKRDGPPVALRASQLNGLNLSGVVVFSEACYMGDEQHPMRQAFLDAGASAVVAGPGKNWGATGVELRGADLLGLWFRRALARGLKPRSALRLARGRVMFAAWRGSQSARDALGFRLFEE